jgi:NADH-quinone oxidoreductase subunit C
MLDMSLYDKDTVLQAHASNPAIQALQTGVAGAIVNAKFDRDELTLVIDRLLIREAAAAVQGAGYNFLEDVTCVDYNPL